MDIDSEMIDAPQLKMSKTMSISNKKVTNQFKSIMIDFNAAQLYFKSLGNNMSLEQMFDMIDVLRTLIHDMYDS